VIEQAVNVCQATCVQDAWERGQPLAVHGWIYGLHDGLLRDMGMTVTSQDAVAGLYQTALAGLPS
jgi:carbonic anhydrase